VLVAFCPAFCPEAGPLDMFFWTALAEPAAQRGVPISREYRCGLTCRVRVYVTSWWGCISSVREHSVIKISGSTTFSGVTRSCC
jgi:hypothetical protein